jgi:DNA-directed RNA polymerase specialized sigma24 family protein
MSDIEGAPPPEDLKGWSAVIATPGALERLKREDVIKAARHRAIQSDRRVFNALMEFLNRIFLKDASGRVKSGWQNAGQEIAERVHHHLIKAVLDPNSADGKQMERRYWAVLKNRTIDAVRKERKKLETTPDTVTLDDAEGIIANTRDSELAEMRADLERILLTVPDERKRLAIRLHLQGVPYKKGKGTTSICEVLGISDKTAGEWVAEMLVLIKSKVGESK